MAIAMNNHNIGNHNQENGNINYGDIDSDAMIHSESVAESASPSPSSTASITRDPIFYITVAFFALLTTGLPALLGQPRFLPIIQTLSLATFVIVALHHRNVRGAITIVAIWLPIQFIVITLLTRILGSHLEAAFNDGFVYRGAITAWFFGGAPLPDGLISSPVGRVIEILGIVVGSLISIGLAGFWFLVRLVNQAGYGTGILLASLANPSLSLLVIPYWTLLRAAGYAGLVILFAQPLLTYRWSPAYYWQNHRRLGLYSVGLVVIALIIELFLPALVARPPLN